MITNKRILITGGAGFIANILISRLIEENTIIAFDNFHRDTLSNSPFSKHKNLNIYKGDVLNYQQVYDCINGCHIVIHAAAIAGIDRVIKKPTHTMRVNMIGTANVFEASKEHKVSD